MFRRWIIYITVLIASFAFYGLYEQYISYYIFLAVAFFPLFSLAISIFGMLRVRIGFLPLPTQLKKGTDANAVIKIYPRSPLPLALMTILYTAENITFCGQAADKADKDGQPDSFTLLLLYGCAKDGVSLPLDTSHTGIIYLDIKKVRVYDYLGLFFFSLKTPDKRSIIVMPEFVRPEPMPVLPVDKIGGKGLRPKPGGGFAEDYDLREYRIGDPLNLIHWKLSSKRDELITREPLVSEKGKIYICFNLFGSPEELDSVFGQVLYISHILLGRMIDFYLCWYDGGGELNTVHIEQKTELMHCLVAILSRPIARLGRAVDRASFRDADWFYIVRPQTDNGGEHI